MECPFPKTQPLLRSLPSTYAMSSPMLSPKLVSVFNLKILQTEWFYLCSTLSSRRRSLLCVQVNHQRLTRGINMQSFALYMHFTFISSGLLTKSSTNHCSTFAKRYFAIGSFLLPLLSTKCHTLVPSLCLLNLVGPSHHVDCQHHLVPWQFPYHKDFSCC